MQAKVENSALITRHSALITLILLHLLIALPLAYLLNIWIDEASTLYTTEHGFIQAFQNTLADEKQAPLYFWLMSLWREAGDSIFFARLFSVICSVSAITIFSNLARKIFAQRTAIWASAFFALHPYLFWASVEIRVYSSVILLSVLLLKLFFEGYFESDFSARKKTRIFYIVVSVIALYTNYYLGFLLVGNFCALLATRKWNSARSYFLHMIAVGACFSPLLWTVKSQFAANTSAFQEARSIVTGLQLLWNIFLTFALPTEIFTPEEISGLSFLRLWLMRFGLLAIIIFLIRNRRRINEKLIGFGVICATIFLFLLAAYFLLGTGYVVIRHTAVLFAPFVILIWLVLEIVVIQPSQKGETKNKFLIGQNAAQILMLVSFAASFSYSLYTLYPNMTKRGDWARIGKFIEQNEKPNQPIIVFWSFDALALPYHYKGINRIFPDEKFFDWENEAQAGSEKSRLRETNFIISRIPPEAQELWLLTNSSCDSGQMCQPLENFLQANYTIVETKDFYQEKLRLLKKND